MIQKNNTHIFTCVGGGQDKPAWTACPPGVKITRVGGKISRDSLPPGGQAVQGGKINCYTGLSFISYGCWLTLWTELPYFMYVDVGR